MIIIRLISKGYAYQLLEKEIFVTLKFSDQFFSTKIVWLPMFTRDKQTTTVGT